MANIKNFKILQCLISHRLNYDSSSWCNVPIDLSLLTRYVDAYARSIKNRIILARYVTGTASMNKSFNNVLVWSSSCFNAHGKII